MITDYDMPFIDGCRLADKIKKTYLETKVIIVYLSETLQSGKRGKASAMLVKSAIDQESSNAIAYHPLPENPMIEIRQHISIKRKQHEKHPGDPNGK